MNQSTIQVSFSRSLVYLLTGLLMACVSSPVFGQADALRPPQTKDPLSGGGFLVYVVALLLVALVVVATLLKSKRTHQD